MERAPLEAHKKNVLKLLMNPYLNLNHRQRSRQARRCPLRTSKVEMFHYTVATTAKSKETIPSDIHIPCNDDASDAKSAGHEIRLIQDPVL